jgi:hypothetical protein
VVEIRHAIAQTSRPIVTQLSKEKAVMCVRGSDTEFIDGTGSTAVWRVRVYYGKASVV